jgi:hypothetical protein
VLCHDPINHSLTQSMTQSLTPSLPLSINDPITPSLRAGQVDCSGGHAAQAVLGPLGRLLLRSGALRHVRAGEGGGREGGREGVCVCVCVCVFMCVCLCVSVHFLTGGRCRYLTLLPLPTSSFCIWLCNSHSGRPGLTTTQ